MGRAVVHSRSSIVGRVGSAFVTVTSARSGRTAIDYLNAAQSAIAFEPRRNRSDGRTLDVGVLNHLTDIPFVGSRAVAENRLTRGRLYGPDVVPLHHDVFGGAAAEITTRVRVLAVSLRAGPDAVVAGPPAALARGAECPWDTAEAVLDTDRRLARDGIRLRICRLSPEEVGERHGVAVTTPLRTAFDLACRRDDPLPDVVAAMETRTRLVFVLSWLPAPVPQYPLQLPDGTWVRLDLAWPEAKVAVEYDGDEHREPARHASDLDRDAGLDDLGWQGPAAASRGGRRGQPAFAARARRAGAAFGTTRSARNRPV